MAAPMTTGSRRRPTAKLRTDSAHQDILDDKNYKSEYGYLIDATKLWFFLLCLYCGILLFIQKRMDTFPTPQFQNPGSRTDHFYEDNAKRHVDEFVKHGPRVVGSDANEIHAKSYILSQLEKIQKAANSSKTIKIDEQSVSGSFHLAFLSDFVSVYKNIKNVVAKLEASDDVSANHSLLISCHFDSSVDSPGAGDNGISCAVMLELLRALSQSADTLQHNIIFLFNGAEENILQASHGFITQHQWAGSIKAFINLDSAGAGGWEAVFQTGPYHPWLVRAYAQSVRYPYGSVIGQEMFQLGIIPSDTDFRIFRDFGNLPGLDIAYITNGYIYHTPRDLPRYLHPGCIQRGGENLLSLLKVLGSSPHLADPGLDKHGTMVFFDLLGYVLIYYPQSVGLIVNSAIVATVIYKILRQTGSKGVVYLRRLATAMLFLVLTWLAVLVTCLLVAMLVTLLGCSMSWFSHTYNIIPLYFIPALVTMLYIQEYLRENFYKGHDPWSVEVLYFEANLTFNTLLTLLLTTFGIASAFMPMLNVLGPLMIRDRTMQLFKKNWKLTPYQFVVLHVMSFLVPLVVMMSHFHALFVLFVPIMGRSGSETNTDIVIACMIVLLLISSTGYLVGLAYICSNVKKLLAILLTVSAVWSIAIFLTPLGFPFRGHLESPSQERVLAVHVDRMFHSKNGEIEQRDSKMWYLPFDQTQYKYLIRELPMMQATKPVPCDRGPFCGMPYLLPIMFLFPGRSSLCAPTSSLDLPRVVARVTDRQKVSSEMIKLSFSVTGPDHISMYVRPREGVSLIRWSMSVGQPHPAKMSPDVDEVTYFVYYSHAEAPSGPWQFSIYFMVSKEMDSVVDIAFAGHRLHGENKSTRELQQLRENLPDWAVPVTWAATYDSYEF